MGSNFKQGAEICARRARVFSIIAAIGSIVLAFACGEDSEEDDRDRYEEECCHNLPDLHPERSYLSDIEIKAMAQFSKENGMIVYELRVANLGPEASTEGAVIIFSLPLTASNIECTATAGECSIGLEKTTVLFFTDSLEVGTEEYFSASMIVDPSSCDNPEGYSANIWGSIPNIELDHSNNRYDFPFPDEDDDGLPDICN